MKCLTKLVPGLTLLALLFATTAAAEGTVIVCTHPDVLETTLKYIGKFYTAPQV
ncbi:MAG: hypothetical protein VYA59_03495 [Pseudomonadota bacterium]|nr:hypothetical protein [Pseudomonadota bacterium]